LRFEPHDDVNKLFAWNTLPISEDFLSGISQLSMKYGGVPADSNLYKVFAWDKPEQLGGKESHIGDLVLDGTFTTSKFGNEDLFFRHQKSDDDLEIHPEWTPYMSAYKTTSKCPFASLW